MDLMTLAAKITLDDSSFKSGIGSAISMGEGLAGKISSFTIAAGELIADVVRKGIAAIQDVIGGAVDGYADYQQLIGGVETLFKGSADKVAAYAKQSFRTTGLSANDYMETVTGFSASLLQGLGGDTEQAAELANMAVQDMADNANKMGTDLSSIQTAYQGFAKQNYTMLDNLKLGYGGTKDEMIRLVNDSGILEKKIDSLDGITFDQLIEAIHKIQEEMGITGTTATEAASTISGSKASLKAAWQDLLTAVAGDGTDQSISLDESLENFKTSFKTYMDNYLPVLTSTVENLGTLVDGVAEAVASMPKNILSNLFQAGLGAGAEMIGGVSKVVNWLIGSITEALTEARVNPMRVIQFGNALGNFVGESVGNILTNLPAIADGLFALGVNLAGSILEGIWDGLFGANSTGNELERIQQEFNSTVSEAELSSIRAQSILSYMSDLEEKYGSAAKETEEWQKAEESLEGVLSGSKATFDEYGENVSGAISYLQKMTEELRKQAIMQAMQEKYTSQLKVLGELESEKGELEWSIQEAREMMTGMDQRRDTTLREYGKILMEPGVLNNPILRGYAETAMRAPGELVDNQITELTDAIRQLYENTPEEETPWANPEGNIISPDVIDSLTDEYAKQEAAIESASTRLGELDGEIEQASAAVNRTLSIMGNMESSFGTLAGAADNAAAHIAKLSLVSPKVLPRTGTTGNERVPVISYMPEATGIDDVPYTGFRAELHKGEAILTKEENEARKRGGITAGEMEAMLESAIRAGMSGMYFNMNGNRVADLTTRRTGQNLSASEHARVRSMGG